MYQELKRLFWWHGMKREIALFVAKCDTCQMVKAEHQRLAGLLQPLKIPEWKWEEIGMDFITGLPRSQKGHDSIWVIVDRLTKAAHFIHVCTTYRVRSWRISTFPGSCVYMESPRKSCRIVVPNLLPCFGSVCMRPLEPS